MQFTTRAARRGLAAAAVDFPGGGHPGAHGRPGRIRQPGRRSRPATLTSPRRPWLPRGAPPGRSRCGSASPGTATPGAPTTSWNCPTPRPGRARCTATRASPPWLPAATSSAARQAAAPASAIRLVTLGRGATAHVLLQIADVANFPPASCGKATAVALRVYPPGDHQVARGPLHLPGLRQERTGLPARGDHGGRDRRPRLQQLTRTRGPPARAVTPAGSAGRP